MKREYFTDEHLNAAFEADPDLPTDLTDLIATLDAQDHITIEANPNLSPLEAASRSWRGKPATQRGVERMLDAKREQQRRDQTDWFKFD